MTTQADMSASPSVLGWHVPGGVVHKLPEDLRKAPTANPTALDVWKAITRLARNEFICWVEDAKQEKQLPLALYGPPRKNYFWAALWCVWYKVPPFAPQKRTRH
ncbi:MAG: YdeI/OmpD-associated family protein [Acidimicrobiales bacterium]